jgi:hypothetical protein
MNKVRLSVSNAARNRKNIECLEIRLPLLKKQRDTPPEKAEGPWKAGVAHHYALYFPKFSTTKSALP